MPLYWNGPPCQDPIDAVGPMARWHRSAAEQLRRHIAVASLLCSLGVSPPPWYPYSESMRSYITFDKSPAPRSPSNDSILMMLRHHAG